MKKWMWLTASVAVVGLAVVLWGGSVFAQEPAKAPGTCGGNWTETAGYCQNASGVTGFGGMMSRGGMGGMMGGFASTSVNRTDMYQYCQNATGTAGYGGMMGAGGMMGRRGMMGR